MRYDICQYQRTVADDPCGRLCMGPAVYLDGKRVCQKCRNKYYPPRAQFNDAIDAADLAAAVAARPADAICGRCGGPNSYCDDYGFFYHQLGPDPMRDYRPVCADCYWVLGLSTGER